MTRQQAFWLMVVLATTVAGYQSFQAPGAFWNSDFFEAPPQVQVGLTDLLNFRDMKFVIGIKDGKLQIGNPEVPGETDSDTDTDESVSEQEPTPPASTEPVKPKVSVKPPKAKVTPPLEPIEPPPPPPPAKPQVTEEYVQHVKQAIREERIQDLTACYMKFLETLNSRAGGSMEFKLHVTAYGVIDRAVTVPGKFDLTIKDQYGKQLSTLSGCVAHKIEGLRVAEPPGGQDVLVPYPIAFALPANWQGGGQ